MTLVKDESGMMYAAVFVDNTGYARGYLVRRYRQDHGELPANRWLVDLGSRIQVLSDAELRDTYARV